MSVDPTTEETLKKLRLTQIEVLDEFVRICDQNGLRYFLVAGTLLGAVRHSGFIPWDDDIDVALLRKDYDRFTEIVDGESQNYIFQTWENDPAYYFNFARFGKKNTVILKKANEFMKNYHGISIDVFPLDTCQSVHRLKQKMKSKFIAFIAVLNLAKVRLIRFEGFKKNVKFIVKLLLRFITKPISPKSFLKLQKKMMTKMTGKDTGFVTNYMSKYNYKREIFPSSYFENTATLTFEGKEYTVPGQYLQVLQKVFGEDYMVLPPVEKRENHEYELATIIFDTSEEMKNN